MSDKPWIKLLSTLYLVFFALAVLVQIVRSGWNPSLGIVSLLLVLLGLYVYDVHHMFDAKDRNRKQDS